MNNPQFLNDLKDEIFQKDDGKWYFGFFTHAGNVEEGPFESKVIAESELDTYLQKNFF